MRPVGMPEVLTAVKLTPYCEGIPVTLGLLTEEQWYVFRRHASELRVTLDDDEITHLFPKSMVNDSESWSVLTLPLRVGPWEDDSQSA
jgi:hypothetical protein